MNLEAQVGRAPDERLVAPAEEKVDEAAEAEESKHVVHEREPEVILEELTAESGEAAALKMPSIPTLPPKSIVEDHRRAHWPYRTWCKFCNMGRGLGEQRGSDQAHDIARVGIDYFFITKESFKLRKELEHPETEEGEKMVQADREAGRIIKCVLVRCHETKSVFAHIVPCKGVDEDNYVVDIVCSDIAWLGHVKILLKTDNEKALLKLVRRALIELKCQVSDLQTVSDEHSVAYDSQSNGGTEVGVRNVRGQFRTLKLCLEDRLGQAVPIEHPVVSWLLEYSCFVLNAVAMGPDGKTAWARARGRDFSGKVYAFAEQVFWKPPTKGPGHDVEGNMGPRMFPGTLLGFHRSSNAYWILNQKGDMVKSRALNSRPHEERWDKLVLSNLRVTPWCLRLKPELQRVPLGEEVTKDSMKLKDVVTNPRQLKITMHILKSFGTTDGCPQCSHIRAFQEAKPGLGHSPGCRKRLVEDMAKTPEGRAKLEAYDHRLNRAIVERHEDLLGQQHEPDHAPAASDHAPANIDGENDASGVRGGMGLPAEEAHPAETPVEWPTERLAQMRQQARMQRERIESRNLELRGGAPGFADDAMAEAYPAPGGPGIHGGNPINDSEGDAFMGLIQEEDDVMTMLAHIGIETRNYQREHKKAFRKIVSEIYSPPRVTKLLSALPPSSLAPGFALDLTCIDPDDGRQWDFDIEAKRTKALALVRRTKPLFLVGSPMCTAFCTWQRLNAQKCNSEDMKNKLEQARVHLEFCFQLYREQLEGGRYFLHEHPKFATSWQEECVEELCKTPGVELVHADQCQLGAEVITGIKKGMPVKKPTGFLSNATHLLERLKRRCEGRGGWCSRRRGGRHATCEGKIARDAARYPRALCKAIIEGMLLQMKRTGITKDGEVGLNAVTDDEQDEQDMRGPEQGYSGRFRDDVTGQTLKDELVHEARAKELRYFHDKGVWCKRPRLEAKQRTGRKAISVRWVDVNKGDELNPRYRSRLVARQLKAHDRSGASFFAPTPPLEALRTILSMTASTMPNWKPCYDPESERRVQISFVDIARAYFNAQKDEDDETYVDLPPEDPDHQQCCAKLLRHMYGTRSAADGWQEEYSSFLVEVMGFEQGMSSPCLFKHPTKQLVCSVHGDDFTTTGAKMDLDWFEETIKQHYECTIQPRVGPGKHDAKEGIVLNRIIRWGEEGLEYEADPRQTEKLIAECGLTGANTVATPGVRLSFEEATKDEPLEPRLHTAFRGAAARANYLASDRMDCQFAAKEICRSMAKPSQAAWNALKRLCRYLVGLPRQVFVYRWQTVDTIDVYTDTDWAGCPKTRKSTSGGCVLVGSHAVKSWSSTQTSVALSSGEAEFNGVVRGSGAGLGYQSLLSDLGQGLALRVWTDSSAAMGICARQGLGKLRHIDTHTLWVQQAVRSRRLELRKIAGEANPADLFTKHSLSRERLMKLSQLFDCKYRSGRAESAPRTRTSPGGKLTMAEANAVDAKGEHIESDPEMPHKFLDHHQLEALHPAVNVPDSAYDEPDLDDDDADGILQEGQRISRQIMCEAKQHGRRRRPGPD